MKREQEKSKAHRKNEKGAALVMALLVSFLLLVASAGLLLEASMNTQNVTDSTAEQQAYNAAESGIQAAVHVLRDNVTLADADRIDPAKPATDPANRINYIKALRPEFSNATGDTSTVPRLSRWLKYEAGTFNDRVKLGEPAYTAQNGYAFSVSIEDPDHTGATVTFSSTGRLYDNDNATGGPISRKTYTNGANSLIVEYIPRTTTTVDTEAGPASVDFGKFVISRPTGIGAVVPAFNRFEIITRMTHPYDAVRVVRGYIESTGSAADIPKIIVDSQTFTLQGSVINLEFNSGTFVSFPDASPQRVGYEAQLMLGDNAIAGTMSSPEPIRLLIKSIGFGPRGSRKQLEAIIQKNFFNGLTAPATLTLIGPPSTTSPASSFYFHPGSSNVTTYTGADQASTDMIPPIGTSNNQNLDIVYDSVDGLPPHPFNGNVVGSPTNVSPEMPDWLSSPQRLDATVGSLYSVANSSGRYFASGVQPSNFGNNATGQGITFCDGNCSFTGAGGGILVVTGTLTLHGNFSFRGLIIVTGQGGVTRSGGGNGTIEGNMVIAPYQNSGVLPVSNPVGTGFLAPRYDLSGGGNSTIAYNSSNVNNGLLAVDNFVLGVAEK